MFVLAIEIFVETLVKNKKKVSEFRFIRNKEERFLRHLMSLRLFICNYFNIIIHCHILRA